MTCSAPVDKGWDAGGRNTSKEQKTWGGAWLLSSILKELLCREESWAYQKDVTERQIFPSCEGVLPVRTVPEWKSCLHWDSLWREYEACLLEMTSKRGRLSQRTSEAPSSSRILWDPWVRKMFLVGGKASPESFEYFAQVTISFTGIINLIQHSGDMLLGEIMVVMTCGIWKRAKIFPYAFQRSLYLLAFLKKCSSHLIFPCVQPRHKLKSWPSRPRACSTKKK